MMVQTDDDAVLQRIESRLRWLALALCAVVAVAVAAWCGSSAQATRDRQSLQRAEALAQRLATRISAALAVGIPFDRLQGVEVAFEHALEQKTGMRRIVLLDANEAMVHEASVPAGPARIAANVYARAAVHRTDPQGREQRAGTVVVESVANDDARFGWDMTLLLLASVSIGALSVSELWRWKLWSGPGVRVRVLRRARELMANGDWTVLPDAEPPTRHGGIRAYAARVHALTERHHRIRRLTASLARSVSPPPRPATRVAEASKDFEAASRP